SLAACRRAAGDLDGAIDALLALVRLDPLQERALRRVMTLLTESGRHLEALREYQHFTEFLARELGVEPEAATKEAYLGILDSRARAPKSGAALDDLPAGLVEAFRSLDALVLYDAEGRFVMCNGLFRDFFPDCRHI